MTAAANIRKIRGYLGTFAPGGFDLLDPAHTGAALVPEAWERLRRDLESIPVEADWPITEWDRAVDRYRAALETAYGLREAGFPGELIAAAFGPAEAR